ncbi:Rrf2 family transcriptional regulator [bacterium]|nr:Rrf2 family transcriptional regulator [bacterium]
MKVSTKGRYALRALLEMAENNSGKPIFLSYIANRQAIPERYLIHIFGALRKAGIVNSYRGAKGGFQLARQPKDISLADVLDAAEGPVQLLDCLQNQYENCNRLSFCATRSIWEKVNQEVKVVFENMTLAQMQIMFRKEKENVEGNYSI